ncbi:hypothetical protein TNCV_93141 [Trichonephila clavipes]|nr:hypothetical protein TNCV_93141 [Trichonephila clavipes]
MELDKFKLETLGHPPYSPGMSPCYFHVFGPLKKHLKGKRFNSNDILKDTEELGLVTGILGTRNPVACSSVGSLCSGLWCIF